MVTNTTSFTYRPRVSLARFLFCWWRHNRLLMTSQWPDNCDAITWIVISNLLDIDFIHGDIHGRSCKKWLFAIWVQIRTICNNFSWWKLNFWLHGSLGSHRYWYRKTSRLVMFTWIADNYNMTVWILAGNYISFTIAADLIRLHMPVVTKSRV